MKRDALTTIAPLAQWPDCCRLIEIIFVRLCAILKDYRTNAAVMQQPAAGGGEPHHPGAVAQQEGEEAGQCGGDVGA